MKKFIALLLSFSLILSFSPLAKAASLSTEKTEILSERSAYGKTYRLANGTYQYIGYTEPIHYKDSSGTYVEINNAITDAVRQAGYKYTNTANQWNVYFSEKLDNSNAVMLTSGKYTISFSLMEKAGTTGVVKATALADSKDTSSAYHQKLSADNRAVVYRDVAENVDIAYTVQADALKEDIILNSKLAPSVYKFRLTTNGLTICESDGKISLCTATGEETFAFAPLYMEDANGKRSEKVSLTYTIAKNGYELTISADTEFLNAKDTVYPVVIDPSVVVSGTVSSEDTYVDQQYPNSNYSLSESLLTGNATSLYEKRTYLYFYYPLNIKPFQITSVYIYMPKKDYQAPNIQAYAVTSGWSTDSLTWNNQPSHNESLCSTLSVQTTRHNNPNWYKMNITDILKGWLDFSIDEYGLVLKETNEKSSTKTSYYSSEAAYPNNPEFEINYNPYYGSRPYQEIGEEYLEDTNCMGYALECPYFIRTYGTKLEHIHLGISESEIHGLTLQELEDYIADKSEDWMSANIGGSNWAYLPTYNSSIDQNWYRVVLRVGFYDNNGNGVLDRFSGNEDFVKEIYDFHWWYQTSTGDWAEKSGVLSTERHPNTAEINPVDLEWDLESTDPNVPLAEWANDFYNSGGVFYRIRDIRTVPWWIPS